MQGLNMRIVSALVALLIVVALFWGFQGNAVYIMIYLACSVAQWEFLSLSLAKSRKALRICYLLISQYFLIHCLPIEILPSISPLKLALQFLVFICFFGLLSEKEKIEEIEKDIFASCFGFIYLGVLPGVLSLILIRSGSTASYLFLYLLVCVFAGDIFAYFSGLLFGKRKMLPLISPKKTIVGCVGGLIGSILCGGAFAYFLLPNFKLSYFAISGILGFYAQIGDFLESLIKRISGKKDSGKIMPGHGGILDRVDGVLFAIPALYFFFF